MHAYAADEEPIAYRQMAELESFETTPKSDPRIHGIYQTQNYT